MPGMRQAGETRGITEPAARRRAGAVLALWAAWMSLAAADLDEVRKQYLAGDYTGCVAECTKALADEPTYAEEWHLLRVRSLLTLGQYGQAHHAVTNALEEEPRSIRLRWAAREALLARGDVEAAARQIEEIVEAVERRPYGYRDAPDLVVVGKVALLKGVDPKRVLDRLFKPARTVDPKHRDPYLAIGELALEKHDAALAAREFREGLARLPDDPDLLYGLARAYESGERALMVTSAEAALERNTNHVGCLLLLADQHIDAEAYEDAENWLDRVGAVNPHHPEAWALRSVVAHLRNRPDEERTARQRALEHWPTNPRVPYRIGEKLSQKYRFAEGAGFQKQALEWDPDYLPAKAQLARDLLRLGEETEGWRLAEEVHELDGYDVAALNLVNLKDTMAKYETLTNEHFQVRMTPHEAEVYGSRVMELLERARAGLAPKYGLELERRVLVEVFAEQKDFAVRTFGMPENHGFLGVCFGNVITANSPASRPGHRFNWESMLWHEFCHVITLGLTRNKMPRWLSEGISVYEERQAGSSWGERWGPQYREMVLSGELTPVSKMSAAFLAPRSELHLQFAYFQSSLVVEFLVERFGAPALATILRDLGEGIEINAAIEKHTATMETIEKDFETFARTQAEAFGPGLDWEKPSLRASATTGHDDTSDEPGEEQPSPQPRRGLLSMPRPDTREVWAAWAASRPDNVWVRLRKAGELIEGEQWEQAKPLLRGLIDGCPEFTDGDGPYPMLALAHEKLGERSAERELLARIARQEDSAIDVYRRLIELGTDAEDWPVVIENAERYLAVDPLVAAPHRALAEAGEGAGSPESAIGAYRTLLRLDPANPGELHYQLARLLHAGGDGEARRQVLMALEEAPRHRAALRLLLALRDDGVETKTKPTNEGTP